MGFAILVDSCKFFIIMTAYISNVPLQLFKKLYLKMFKVIICLHIDIRFQVFLSNTNNLLAIVWRQVKNTTNNP